MSKLFTDPRPQFTLADGVSVNTAGKLHFREPGSGSTTYKDVYSEPYVDSSTPKLTNPVILSEVGKLTQAIWLNGDYNIEITDSSGTTIDQENNINPDEQGPAEAWNSLSSYSIDDIVYYSGNYYISTSNSNVNQTPSSSSQFWTLLAFVKAWNTKTTYAEGDIVIHSGTVYKSKSASNQGNNPLIAFSGETYWGPAVELGNLDTSTSDTDGDFFVVVDSSGIQRRLTKANIDVGGFDTGPSGSVTGSGESKTSDSTLANSPELSGFVLDAGKKYEYTALLVFESSSATPDAKFKLNIASGIPSFRHESMVAVDAAGVVTADSGSGVTYIIPLDGTNINIAHLTGFIGVSSQVTCDIQWSQNTSDATATTLNLGSTIKFREV